MSKERFSCSMKKMCLMTPEAKGVTVRVAAAVIELPSAAVAVAVYVVVALGVTVAVPLCKAQAAHTELSMVSAVAVPPVICQDKVALWLAGMVAGDTLRLRVKGTVTVSDWLTAVPSDDVAVRVKVVVLLRGTTDDPETGNGPVSSDLGTAGEMTIEAALVVAQVMVVV
jgi:hypothetical protein